MLLAAGNRPADAPDAPAPMDGLPKPVGRLLEDDASAKAAAAAREAARIAREEGRAKDLPPLELHETPDAPRAPTPAEQAAADLDPIEDLISQIMIDPPRAQKASPARPRAAERKRPVPSVAERAEAGFDRLRGPAARTRARLVRVARLSRLACLARGLAHRTRAAASRRRGARVRLRRAERPHSG